MTPDALARLRLARTEGVGPVTYRRLLARYGDAAAALAALPDLAASAGRRAPMRIPAMADVEREVARVAAAGARLLFLGQPPYPALLGQIADPPPVIAVAGDPALLARPAVALVGARNASANGRRMAETLAAELARAGLVVVSGLARGIDTAAHQGALSAGTTVACVAGGIDVAYPAENQPLQARIGEAGAVVAEAPPGTVAQARHFPRRNRLIAGLSLGVVVVEAALKSGSLITARLAAEANREVFAVPGSPLDERCRGSNSLLRDGAQLVETAEDVVGNLPGGLFGGAVAAVGRQLAEPEPEPDMAPGERGRAREFLVSLLGPAPAAVDDLVRRCQLPPSVVMSVLLDLEIAGRIETLPGNRVALIADPSR